MLVENNEHNIFISSVVFHIALFIATILSKTTSGQQTPQSFWQNDLCQQSRGFIHGSFDCWVFTATNRVFHDAVGCI